MAGAKFDIQFAGELMEGADPQQARLKIQHRFKLSDEAVKRLFKGDAVTIKHAVDTTAASNYRKLFREAGALVRVLPVSTATKPAPKPASAPPTADPPPRTEPDSTPAFTHSQDLAADSGLTLQSRAEQEKVPLEQPPLTGFPVIDVSHVSLVAGQNWTLEDCQTPPEPTAVPDTSQLRFVSPAPDGDPGKAPED